MTSLGEKKSKIHQLTIEHLHDGVIQEIVEYLSRPDILSFSSCSKILRKLVFHSIRRWNNATFSIKQKLMPNLTFVICTENDKWDGETVYPELNTLVFRKTCLMNDFAVAQAPFVTGCKISSPLFDSSWLNRATKLKSIDAEVWNLKDLKSTLPGSLERLSIQCQVESSESHSPLESLSRITRLCINGFCNINIPTTLKSLHFQKLQNAVPLISHVLGLKTLICDNLNLIYANKLSGFRSMEWMDIHMTGQETLDMPNLKFLDVRSNTIESFYESFSKCTQLTSLRVFTTNLPALQTKEQFEYLIQCTNLQRLIIPMGEDYIVPALVYLTKLELLWARGTHQGRNNVHNHERFIDRFIPKNSLETTAPFYLSGLTNLTQLNVDLSIAEFPIVPNLKRLNARSREFDWDGIQVFPKLIHVFNQLYSTYPDIPKGKEFVLAKGFKMTLKSMPKLKSLASFSGTLTNDALRNLHYLTNLIWLEIEASSHEIDLVKHLTELVNLRQLTIPKISKEEIPLLKKLPQLKSLTTTILLFNKNISEFQEFPKLSFLELRNIIIWRDIVYSHEPSTHHFHFGKFLIPRYGKESKM